jgi:hypothetical protein
MDIERILPATPQNFYGFAILKQFSNFHLLLEIIQMRIEN